MPRSWSWSSLRRSPRSSARRKPPTSVCPLLRLRSPPPRNPPMPRRRNKKCGGRSKLDRRVCSTFFQSDSSPLRIQNFLEILLLPKAHEALHDLPALEQDHRRDGADRIAHRHIPVGIGVELADLDLAGVI